MVQRGKFLGKTNETHEKKGGGCERASHVSSGKQVKGNCLIHPNAGHFTRKCREFRIKTPTERAEIVKATKGCILCLSVSHINKPCPFSANWQPCGVDGCQDLHSRLVHEAIIQGFTMHIAVRKNHTLLLMQSISTKGGSIHALFDNGSTSTLISASYGKKQNLKGIRVMYELITVGNQVTVQHTYLHEITLYDRKGKVHVLQAYEIEDICG